MLLFSRTEKRRKDKRQEPQGQRDSRHPQGAERKRRADERRGGRERERGAGGKQPLRLCRETNKNLPLSRAKRERRSRVGFGAREGEEKDAEQGTKGAQATAPISGAARRRSPNDRRAGTRARAAKPRRNGEGKGREEKAAHVTNYPRSLRHARGAHRREAQRSKQAHGESTPKPKQCERIATRARPIRRERKEQTAERSGADRRRSATAAVSIRR